MDNDDFNYKFSINMSDGEPSTVYPMPSIVKKMCRKAGIHSSINPEKYNVSQTITHEVDTSLFKKRLLDASEYAGFKLTPIQIETVANSVWRPSSKTMVKYELPVSGNNNPNKKMEDLFTTPPSDMGSPVFIDLPPGMGKTIVGALSCMIISLERRHEINKPRIMSSQTGLRRFSEKHGSEGNVSMVFVPKHVHHQWIKASNMATNILRYMYPSFETVVLTNKKASTVEGHMIGIIVCDSSSCSPSKMIESSVVYGTICYDECAEVSCAKSNAIVSKVPYTLLYGRAIMISADFSGMGGIKGMNIPGAAMIKRVFGDVMSNAFDIAMGRRDYPGVSIGGSMVAACLTTNSVFSKDYRSSVIDESAMLLDGVNLHAFCVRYKRSVLERLGVSAGFDLTPVSGNARFKDIVGVDISDCDSIDQIMARVKAYGESDHNSYQRSRRVHMALQVLGEVIREDCVICLEPMQRASIIQPCFHVVCGNCFTHIRRQRCPMCRNDIENVVTSNISGKRTFDDAFEHEVKMLNDKVEADKSKKPDTSEVVEKEVPEVFVSMGDSVGKGLVSSFPNNTGEEPIKVVMEKTMEILRASHIKSGGGTFRGLVICSKVDLNTTGFNTEGYDIIAYKTVGSKHAPVTRKKFASQLDKFQADDGKHKLLLVHDSSFGRDGRKDDNITGMDFPKLDAVVSIGSENRSQRMGRLCRMSRMFLEKDKRDAVYIEIVGA